MGARREAGGTIVATACTSESGRSDVVSHNLFWIIIVDKIYFVSCNIFLGIPCD